MRFLPAILISAALALAACNSQAPDSAQSTETGVDMTRVRTHIEVLASDAFEGRAPGTPGGDKSEAYLAEQMKKAGMLPGNGDSYFQSVPMVSITLDTTSSNAALTGDGIERAFTFGSEIVYHTRQIKDAIQIKNSDVVFVGYGIVAPEYDHDDYADIDVTGKTVVMLVNDPGFATQDPKIFKGRTMTYYGRWDYKFEEASRQGAAAALIIHQTAPAAYGWNVVEGGWSGPQFDLVREDGYAGRVAMEGWITDTVAKELFALSGLDFEALSAAAQSPSFNATPMGTLKLNAALNSQFEYISANNVIGMIMGSEAPDEAILYMAHFDHLGVVDGGQEGEDVVFNGAVDNATGTAAILAIGEAFAAAPTPPKRSILIVAVTAEESGLLGSAYFADNPVLPLAQLVGGINIDAIIPTGPATDVVVTGLGASELEDVLSVYAQQQSMTLAPEGNPSAGFFYRSDHISLAKKGVPMLYLDGGQTLIDGGIEAGLAANDAYYAGPYHAVSDNYSPDWNFGTIEQVTNLAYETGNALARSTAWPNWYDGNEFKALRDAMRADAAR